MSGHRVIGALLLALGSWAPGAAAWSGGETDPGPPVQFDFWGFSIAPEPQQVGDELEIVGVLNETTTNTPIPMNFSFSEYTVYVHGLILSERIPNGPFVQSTYRGGVAEIWGDPAFNAPFQSRSDPQSVPPLDPLAVPANFADGLLVCQLTFRNCITLFYPAAGIGTIAYTASEPAPRVDGGCRSCSRTTW
jgi:hypothetical protein